MIVRSMLQEDARLQQLVRAYGAANWSVIAEVTANTAPNSVEASFINVAFTMQSLNSSPPRNGKSCRLRYVNLMAWQTILGLFWRQAVFAGGLINWIQRSRGRPSPQKRCVGSRPRGVSLCHYIWPLCMHNSLVHLCIYRTT